MVSANNCCYDGHHSFLLIVRFDLMSIFSFSELYKNNHTIHMLRASPYVAAIFGEDTLHLDDYLLLSSLSYYYAHRETARFFETVDPK